MKFRNCQQVRLIRDRERYRKEGVEKGRTGFIMDPRSIEGTWLVSFSGEMVQDEDGCWGSTDIECIVLEEDLEAIEGEWPDD